MSTPKHFKAEWPYCGQHVEVPDALASDWITCPNEACGKSFPPAGKKSGAPPREFAVQTAVALGRLTACSDCAGKVSHRAHFCPHCGAPLPAKPGILAIVLYVVISAIAVSILLAFIVFLFGGILARIFSHFSH